MLRPCASERVAPGTTAAITAAPLRMDRRDTSVGGTRAVVSSQQLMNDLLRPNYAGATRMQGFHGAEDIRECRSKELRSGAKPFFARCSRRKIVLYRPQFGIL